jgi:hypothetical protein
MVDFDLQPEEFRALLDTVDGTVLGLPEKVMAATAAGEDLTGALRDSVCAPAVRFIVAETMLRGCGFSVLDAAQNPNLDGVYAARDADREAR